MPTPSTRQRARPTLRVAVVRAALLVTFAAGNVAFAQGAAGGAGQPAVDAGVLVDAPRRRGQGWSTEASVTAVATATNNANYGDNGGGAGEDRAGDLILEFMPALSFNREGRRLRVNGYVAFNALGYVNGTQVNRILPNADVAANLEAIENLFFVDAALQANQSVVNPFLAGSGYSSTNNIYTRTQVQLAPYAKGNIGANARWQVRSDNTYTWTSQTDDPLGNAYYVRNLAEVERDPTPFGMTLRLVNDLTRVTGQVQEDQTLNTALALFDYAVSPQLTVGLRAGYEDTTYTFEGTSGPIYGATLAWRPSPVTNLVGFWEDRFYGSSYQIDFSHRQRRVASTLSSYRSITTNPQVLFQIPPTSSVSGLLDSILTARYPDPVDRAGLVQDLVARQGLPQSLPAGTYIYNQSPNILTGINAGVALIGVRNTVALNYFYLKTEALADARIPPTFLAFNNNIQQGGGVTLSHRLSPVLTFNGTVSTQSTEGFGQNEGLSTRENVAKAQVNWQMSPRSTLFVGARYQVQTSPSAALSGTESNETAVFTGLFHRL